METILQATGAPDSDAGLVRQLKCGSPQAFEELLDAYEGPIYGFVYRQLDDPADAPDVTQEVFLKVFRKICEFRSECTLKTWIYRIAVHEAANRRRWFSRHRRNEVAFDGTSEERGGWDWLRDPRGDPYDTVCQQEERELVEDVLREVDERLRCAVVLRDLQGLAYNEIAETLQISLGTVKSRILRGREALKAKLQRRLAGQGLGDVSLQRSQS